MLLTAPRVLLWGLECHGVCRLAAAHYHHKFSVTERGYKKMWFYRGEGVRLA
jgi:hypothetical protein